MIWFLNATHSFPDLKASLLTPERFENKHPRRHACCQRGLNLLNVAGYRCTLTANGLCNSNSAPDGTVTPPVGRDGPRAWKRRGCREPPAAAAGILPRCQEGTLRRWDGRGEEKRSEVRGQSSHKRSRCLYSRKRRMKAF